MLLPDKHTRRKTTAGAASSKIPKYLKFHENFLPAEWWTAANSRQLVVAS
jgi:hypothetical protein